jgi:hypothetical protein
VRCVETASCMPDDHSYSWPFDLALRVAECTQCDCPEFDWNCRSRALKTDPPSTCECGHEEAKHRFRRGES